MQITDEATSSWEEIMRQDRIPVDMSVAAEPLSLPVYIEECRMKLWDKAFVTYFRGNEAFKKLDDFAAFKGTDQIVRRVIFR